MNKTVENNLFNGIERHHVIELLEWMKTHPGKDPHCIIWKCFKVR